MTVGWTDGKDNIEVVKRDEYGEIVPIQGNAIAHRLSINGSLYVKSPITGYLNADWAEIGYALGASDAEIGESLFTGNAEIGFLNAENAEIGRCLGASHAEIGKGGLSAEGAVIGEDLDVNRSVTDGSLLATGAEIGRNLRAEDAEIGESLYLSDTKIGGDLYLRGASIEYLNIEDVQIRGLLDLRGARVNMMSYSDTSPVFDRDDYRVDADTEIPDGFKDRLEDYENQVEQVA